VLPTQQSDVPSLGSEHPTCAGALEGYGRSRTRVGSSGGQSDPTGEIIAQAFDT